MLASTRATAIADTLTERANILQSAQVILSHFPIVFRAVAVLFVNVSKLVERGWQAVLIGFLYNPNWGVLIAMSIDVRAVCVMNEHAFNTEVTFL